MIKKNIDKEIIKLEVLSKDLFGNNWIIPLAKFVGVTRQAVYLWIHEKRKIPRSVIVCLSQRKKLKNLIQLAKEERE